MPKKRNCRVIAVINQKGGVGKTTASINIAAALSLKGKKVLLIDFDPQSSLSNVFGFGKDKETKNICSLMENVLKDEEIEWSSNVYTHPEGYDFIPSSIMLSSMEQQLVVAELRETVLRRIVACYYPYFDFIIIDANPSLGLLSINAMYASDEVIIPISSDDMSIDGLDLLLKSIFRIRRNFNSELKITGILPAIVDTRNPEYKFILSTIKQLFEEEHPEHIHVFKTFVPRAVSCSRIKRYNGSIFVSDPKGKAAEAYMKVADEVLANVE